MTVKVIRILHPRLKRAKQFNQIIRRLDDFLSMRLIALDTSEADKLCHQRARRGTVVAQVLVGGVAIMFRPFIIMILLFVAMAAAPGCSHHQQQQSTARGTHAVVVHR
ncbi:MAG TPA: hypothetical protein VKA60_14160 [Blastocatellia bacterium]|nr:hypothetical protein [Blastocatellia bacterium]